ncbi:hypothetical protein HQ520_04315 [bacterium]|nr:hypothetical protein [bacterium]
MRRSRRPKPPSSLKTAVLVAAIFVTFAVGVALSDYRSEVVRWLYSPIAIVLVILLFIEYIVLKGRDRSRIYRIELEQARHKRVEDQEYLRHLEERLLAMEKEVPSPPEVRDSGCEERLGELRGELASLRRELSEKL